MAEILQINALAGNNGNLKPLHYQSRISVNRYAANATSTSNVSIGYAATGVLPFAYHASEWSNASFVAEFSIYVTNATNTGYVGIWDLTSAAAVAGSEVSTTSTTGVSIRSGGFTLTDGHVHSFYLRSTNTSYNIYCMSADIVALF